MPARWMKRKSIEQDDGFNTMQWKQKFIDIYPHISQTLENFFPTKQNLNHHSWKLLKTSWASSMNGSWMKHEIIGHAFNRVQWKHDYRYHITIPQYKSKCWETVNVRKLYPPFLKASKEIWLHLISYTSSMNDSWMKFEIIEDAFNTMH